MNIQGAVFAFADPVSKLDMTSNFTGTSACIAGTAAKVNLNCTLTPPATDCYGQYFGAAIGMNLNQALDPTTMVGADPLPFDASALVGFSFEISGSAVPAPSDFRFEVETSDQRFCNVQSKAKLKVGSNTMFLRDLLTECFRVIDPPAPSAETAKTRLVRIAWHVITNTTSTSRFDFCVSNVRARTL